MLGCYQQLAARPSYQDSLKILEADIHHANMLAASIPRGNGGTYLQMNLVCHELAPILMRLLQYLDCSRSCLFSTHLNLFHVIIHKVRSTKKPKISSHGRKATVGEFYAVILPSLKRLNTDSVDEALDRAHSSEKVVRKRREEESERDDECGICLEACTKMVLPSCCHAMCINCYRDCVEHRLVVDVRRAPIQNHCQEFVLKKNTRSESCPFCRGSLKRVKSEDLWVLTCGNDVVDTQTALREDLLRFYLFVNKLPEDVPEALFIMYYEYLI